MGCLLSSDVLGVIFHWYVYQNAWGLKGRKSNKGNVRRVAYRGVMLRLHQTKAKSERDISLMKTVNLYRAIHTKRKWKRFHLNGLQSHSSESESNVAFAFVFTFAWCERTIRVGSHVVLETLKWPAIFIRPTLRLEF